MDFLGQKINLLKSNPNEFKKTFVVTIMSRAGSNSLHSLSQKRSYFLQTNSICWLLNDAFHRNIYPKSQQHPKVMGSQVFKGGHTSQNSFYKWTKIPSLEIIIFELKNVGKKWSRIYFEIQGAL